MTQPSMADEYSDLVKRLDHLGSLNEVRNGGPYGGHAAAECMKAMAEAAQAIQSLMQQVEGQAEPVAWRKPKHPYAQEPLFIDPSARTEDWMKAIFTVPVYAAPQPEAHAGVVKALEWEGVDATSKWAHVREFWCLYRVSLRADRQKVLRLEWRDNQTDELGLFLTWDGAYEAAQADFEQRIRSSLDPAPNQSNDR